MLDTLLKICWLFQWHTTDYMYVKTNYCLYFKVTRHICFRYKQTKTRCGYVVRRRHIFLIVLFENIYLARMEFFLRLFLFWIKMNRWAYVAKYKWNIYLLLLKKSEKIYRLDLLMVAKKESLVLRFHLFVSKGCVSLVILKLRAFGICRKIWRAYLEKRALYFRILCNYCWRWIKMGCCDSLYNFLNWQGLNCGSKSC